jgi:hypothetical protein
MTDDRANCHLSAVAGAGYGAEPIQVIFVILG